MRLFVDEREFKDFCCKRLTKKTIHILLSSHNYETAKSISILNTLSMSAEIYSRTATT